MKFVRSSFNSVETSEGTRPRCTLCTSPGAAKEFSKKGASYYRCTSCGHIFVFPVPSPDQTTEHYQSSYTESYLTEMTPWFQELARRRISLIRKHAPELTSLSILDVGCGYGFFLKAATAHGCQAMGLDNSEACAAYARERFRIPVVSGDVRDSLPHVVSERRFDIITFWHVLEHLDDPRAALRSAIRGLKENGLLVLNSPNMDSAVFAIAGRWWSWIYSPGHVQYFSLQSLAKWLQAEGLAVVGRETWTDAPNLYFLVEEAILFRIADFLDRFGGRPGRRFSKKLEGFLYGSFHQMWVQKQWRRLYHATPWLDGRLKKRERGHEFVIVARKPPVSPRRRAAAI